MNKYLAVALWPSVDSNWDAAKNAKSASGRWRDDASRTGQSFAVADLSASLGVACTSHTRVGLSRSRFRTPGRGREGSQVQRLSGKAGSRRDFHVQPLPHRPDV